MKFFVATSTIVGLPSICFQLIVRNAMFVVNVSAKNAIS